jgi:hypothetical protein
LEKGCADRLMELLKRDPDLIPLRDRVDFKKLTEGR